MSWSKKSMTWRPGRLFSSCSCATWIKRVVCHKCVASFCASIWPSRSSESQNICNGLGLGLPRHLLCGLWYLTPCRTANKPAKSNLVFTSFCDSKIMTPVSPVQWLALPRGRRLQFFSHRQRTVTDVLLVSNDGRLHAACALWPGCCTGRLERLGLGKHFPCISKSLLPFNCLISYC